jgi:hypothetical protein
VVVYDDGLHYSRFNLYKAEVDAMNIQRLEFSSMGLTLVGNLYTPDDFDAQSSTRPS